MIAPRHASMPSIAAQMDTPVAIPTVAKETRTLQSNAAPICAAMPGLFAERGAAVVVVLAARAGAPSAFLSNSKSSVS